MPDPLTVRDLEFFFANGDVLAVTLQDGRDVLDLSPTRISLSFLDPLSTVTIDRAKLNYWRSTTRTLIEP